jgi:hypothetical protein
MVSSFHRGTSLGLAVCLIVLGFAADAVASTTPTLARVGQQNRHATADFAAPGADDATIYFATKPDRASDGRFLDENVKDLDILTSDEIQAGHWTNSSQLDPGTYFVMLRASDIDCLGDPNCLDGFSQVLTLTVPVPAQRFRAKVEKLAFTSTVSLGLTVTPLGERLPYRVCWSRIRGPRKCVSGTVDGFSWDASASDSLTVRTRGMRRRTTFTWFVRGRKVASKSVRISP